MTPDDDLHTFQNNTPLPRQIIYHLRRRRCMVFSPMKHPVFQVGIAYMVTTPTKMIRLWQFHNPIHQMDPKMHTTTSDRIPVKKNLV